MIKRYFLVVLLVLLLFAAPSYADNYGFGENQKSFLKEEAVASQNKVSVNDNSDIPILLSGDCSDYVDLSGRSLPILVVGTTAGATNNYGPFPSQPPSWHGLRWYPGACGGPDKTYKWTAPMDGFYTISLLGSSYDTGLLLYNFTCPREPSYPDDFIAGNDDVWGMQSELFCQEFSAGQEILIVVDGYDNSYGNYQLRIKNAPSPRDPDSFISSIMQTEHIPGLSACAISDGEVIWSGNYGHANIAQDIEPTDSTLYVICSISKTFVAVALMQLWEDGLFGLDDDISRYLPWEEQNPYYPSSPITFRMLMTHTSSIIDNWNILDQLYTWGGDSPVPLGEFLMNYLTPEGSYYSVANFGNYVPGTVYNYGNVATALAAYLVEKINPDSLSFEDYCQRSIFSPLGMNNSSWFLGNLDPDDIAVPYYWSGGNYISIPQRGQPWYPCGSLKTSTNQLAHYLIAIMQHGQFEGARILDSTTVEMITTIQLPDVDPNTGLFWVTYRPGNREAWGHNGEWSGYKTQMWYSPTENTGVIVLTNGLPNLGHWYVTQGLFEYISYRTEVSESSSAPNQISISQNYPNPFNAQTMIQYTLPTQSEVSIDIFDILGRNVEKLIEGMKPAGNHQAIWDAGDQASGIYFYRIKAGDKIETKKMLLMK